MHCPVCLVTTLAPIQLEPTLVAHSCASCGGIWLASNVYWTWLDYRHDALPQDDLHAGPAADVERAKRCPGCGYVMLSYRISDELAFHLDQCGHCNSFWLDRNEWSALKAAGLHDRLHKVAGEPWQRELRVAEHRRVMGEIYTERFGAADYAEAQRVRAWLAAHPARSMLLAYLASDDPYAL